MVEFQSGEKGSLRFYYIPRAGPVKRKEEGLPITLYLQKNKKAQEEKVTIMQINSMKGAFKYYRSI